MADGSSGRVGVEPDAWFLVFSRETPRRWLSWLAMGRFKHVLAIGLIRDQRMWVIYEVELGRTRIAVLPECQGAFDLIADLRRDGETIAMPSPQQQPRFARVGFWCVPAMAHLVGVKRMVFRPDALFRACLAQGGSIVTW